MEKGQFPDNPVGGDACVAFRSMRYSSQKRSCLLIMAVTSRKQS